MKDELLEQFDFSNPSEKARRFRKYIDDNEADFKAKFSVLVTTDDVIKRMKTIYSDPANAFDDTSAEINKALAAELDSVSPSDSSAVMATFIGRNPRNINKVRDIIRITAKSDFGGEWYTSMNGPGESNAKVIKDFYLFQIISPSVNK